jgi:WD40 repeat protein
LSAIFLSHSSADNDVALQIRDWLEKQGYRSVFLDFDPAQGIPHGRDWERELYAQLRASRAVIVLCSRYSMASPWCFAEITHARALGKALFPLKVADCEIQALLQTVQVVDLTVRREEGLDRLSRGLKAAGLDPAGSFDWDGSRPPYPGLLAFEEPDAAVFFGRENEIRDGLDTLGRQRRFGGARFVLLLGGSGSGKSSLLRAGIIPRLRRNPDQWIIVPPFRPLGRPFESLAYALAAGFEEAGAQREWRDLHGLMAAERAGDAPAQLAQELRFSMHRREATVLFCIDQLEELFTLSGPEEAERFLAMARGAAEAVASPILIAATLRSDFLGAVQSQAALREASFAQLLVNPMSLASIGQIIEGPANVANLELEPGLIQAMLQETEAEGALPLLAFTLRELWEHRQGDRLTLALYRDQLGGLSGSVAQAAESVLAGAQAISSVEETQLRQAFLSLVRLNDEGRFTRRPANWADLPVRIHPLLERFVQARLLVSRQDNGARVLEVAHEALFRVWGRLTAWLDQDRAFLLWRKRLDQAMDFWIERGKSREGLLTGALLRESEAQLKEHGEPLSNEERSLIRDSVAAHRRRLLIRGTAVVGVLFLLIYGAYTLWDESRLAKEQHDLNLARQLAQASLTEGSNNLQRSLLLATASLKLEFTKDGFEAWSKAIELFPHRPSLILGAEDGPYADITFSPDGSRMAAAGKNSIFVVDSASLTKGSSPKILATVPQAGATTLAFSPPNGQLLASAVGDKVTVWTSVDQPQPVKELPADGHRIQSIAFDSGAKRLASAGMNYYARVFETEGWTEIGWIGDGAALATAFSPDGRWLLTSGPKLVAWDLATALRPRGSPRASSGPASSVIIDEQGQTPYFLAFSRDGRWLAESGGLWSVAPAEAGTAFSVSGKRVIGSGPLVAVNADASFVATLARDGEFDVWGAPHDNTDPQIAGRILEGRTVAFGPTGTWLVSAGDRLERWDLTAEAGAAIARLRHDAGVVAVAVSPNGRYAATTTADGFAHIWETSNWNKVKSLEIRRSKPDLATSNIAFSRDGRWLVATSENVSKIFSTDGWRKAFEKEHDQVITSAAFDPDGRWVVTVANDTNPYGVDVIAVDSWQPTHVDQPTRVDAIKISHDGRWLLTKTNAYCARAALVRGIARVWKIKDGEPQASVPLDKAPGCHLVSADRKESAAGDVELVKDSANWTDVPIAPPAEISSPDGLWMAKRRSDSIELRASDARRRLVIEYRTNGANDMAFSRDGRWLVTTGNDGIARVWALTREDMIIEACARLTHDLSEDEWQTYLGEEPYVPVCRGLPALPQ